jgi:geranylgeranyl reductase family protein
LNISVNILIIGAGPAGIAAAMQLAKEKVECTIVDKAVFPRDKICGDALSGKVVEVMNKMDASLIQHFSGQHFQVGSWGVKFVAPNGNCLRLPFNKNFNKQTIAPGFICKRFDFDHYMLQQIKSNPYVQIIEGIEMNEFHPTANGLICQSHHKRLSVEARLVIAADGAQSRFARWAGNQKPDPRHYCAGIRTYYKNVAGMDAENFIELHFIKSLLPGYFWIFPLPNGYANVGLGMRTDQVSKHRINLKKMLQHIITTHPAISPRFKYALQQSEIKGFGLPLGSKKRKISGNHYLLTGDAASLIDPFTGEGIGNAMLSGMLAAQHAVKCLQANNFSSAFNRQYDEAVYKRLWHELKLSHTLQRLAMYPTLFNYVVNKANKNITLKETISAMFEDIDLRKQLGRPSFYLNLLFD